MNDYYDDDLPRGDELPYINRTGEFLRLCADWETEEALTPAQRVSELERAAEIARGGCMSARTDAAYHDLGRAPYTTLCWRCSAEYAADAIRCPQCRAANANHDFEAACREMQAERSHA